MAFLALAIIGAGSSYGRAPDKQEAIDICARTIVSDWGGLYDVEGKPCSLNVFDIGELDEVHFDSRGVYTLDAEQKPTWLERLELVEVTLPAKKGAKKKVR